MTLTSTGSHDGHSAVGDIGGGELPGESWHGGLEPGEHCERDPNSEMSEMADTESGTEAAVLRSRENGRKVSSITWDGYGARQQAPSAVYSSRKSVCKIYFLYVKTKHVWLEFKQDWEIEKHLE